MIEFTPDDIAMYKEWYLNTRKNQYGIACNINSNHDLKCGNCKIGLVARSYIPIDKLSTCHAAVVYVLAKYEPSVVFEELL